MTSNQIAASQLEETIRHDRTSEDETQRHNEASESIQSEANEISKRAQEADADYKKRSLDLQEQYNETYLKLQEAQADEKERYQRELNRIAQEQLDLDEEYKEISLNINQQHEDNIAAKNAEDARHNAEIEALSKQSNEISNKVAEYNRSYQIQSNEIADKRAQAEIQRIRNDYELGLMNVEIQSAKNLLTKESLQLEERKVQLEEELYPDRRKNVQADTKLKNSQRIRNYAGVVSDAIPDDISVF